MDRDRILVFIPRLSAYFHDHSARCSLWNARSLQNKLPGLTNSLIANKTDVFILTETWFKDNDDTVEGRFRSVCDGFIIHQVPRKGRNGGGIAIISKAGVNSSLDKTNAFKTSF